MAEPFPAEYTPIPNPPAKKGHCWDPVLDDAGIVPICIPVDSVSKPFRMIQVTRDEQMTTSFKCCYCGTRGSRRFRIVRDHAGHGSQHHAFAFEETEKLPTGDCPGRA